MYMCARVSNLPLFLHDEIPFEFRNCPDSVLYLFSLYSIFKHLSETDSTECTL
jgi:hypothetical protein